ncbi:uncharacterized protein LOC135482819 isoform X2 [Lineus longissimus]|uniref:uncharacterized protein LOC135482819 isoform X2 n=1 Tax=Lineus longissimus TaxID=88925 RepID=UPI002B4D96DD
MTSLSPGVLFHSTGLNQKSTPIAPDATSVEIEKIHKKVSSRTRKKQSCLKEPYNGNPWPRDSPVAMVYDVGNSSTSMILLNNRKKNNSRLRGQSALSKGSLANEFGELEINPDRHFAHSNLNREGHNPCLNSQSPYFEPETQPHIDWRNKRQRPPWKPCESSVNAYRHASCRQPTDPIFYSLEHQRPSTTPSGRRSRGPRSIENNYYLHHPELSFGQRLYLWSTAHVYSLTDMKSLKQRQYLDLLRREKNRGFHTDKEYQQYDRFIRTPRRLTSDDYYRDRERSQGQRARTAGGRLEKDEGSDKQEEEPQNDSQKDSRGTSTKNVSANKRKKEEEERKKNEEDERKEKEKTLKKEKEVGYAQESNEMSGKPQSAASVKRDSKSASSKKSSAKGSRSSSRASKASKDKVSKTSDDEELILSSDPDTRDKRGRGPTHVNVDVASTNPSVALSQEPIDREPKDVDKLEY